MVYDFPQREGGVVVSQSNRRTTLRLLGGAALTAVAMPMLTLPVAAQDEDLVVPNSLQNFKRGTINTMRSDARSFTIIWQDLGFVKMKAADLVTNFGSLLPDQLVDVQWYNYMDFLIAKTTPTVTERAKEMLAKGARLEGIPGAQERIRLWQMAGMCTKIDMSSGSIFLINAAGGEPDKPAPNSGEVIQMPQVVTAAGKSALATLKPGDQVTTVFSQQTAIKVTIIR